MIQEEEEDDENMDKMWKSFFQIIIMHILHHNTMNFCMLVIFHLDILKSEINFKLKVKMNKMLIYGFQWG